MEGGIWKGAGGQWVGKCSASPSGGVQFRKVSLMLHLPFVCFSLHIPTFVEQNKKETFCKLSSQLCKGHVSKGTIPSFIGACGLRLCKCSKSPR